MGKLQLKNIAVGYGQTPILKDLSLEVDDGKLLSLLGPSGVGKTSLLKTIAGLNHPLHGNVLIDNMDVTRQPADKRDVVLLFQKPLLFPFLNVFENIVFGLKIQKKPQAQLKLKAEKVMSLTEITQLGTQKPGDLSGGQQQRVALARALILEPSLLLLDEPLSSLDVDLRQKMQALVRGIQQQTGTTMLFVTHDQSEAFAISDRIALMLGGEIVQTGTPEQLFTSPNTPEVASFFGNPNVIAGRVRKNVLYCDTLKIPVDIADTESCRAIIRPEDITLSDTELPGFFPGTITQRRFEGALTRLVVQLGPHTFTILSITGTLSDKANIWFSLPKEKLHFFNSPDSPSP